MDKGDFVMVEDHMIPYFDQVYPRFRRESIFVMKEYMEH